MLALDENPPMYPPSIETIAGVEGDWWVAHTKARFEKALAFDLLAKDIPYYLPMVMKVTMSGGRKRRVMQPLFTSYLFFCGSPAQRYEAMTTNRVCQILPVRERSQFVNEIAAVERVLRQNAYLEMYPTLPVGARCRVKAGPFMGIEGTITRRDHKDVFVLNVSILGRGAVLEIDGGLLEAVV